MFAAKNSWKNGIRNRNQKPCKEHLDLNDPFLVNFSFDISKSVSIGGKSDQYLGIGDESVEFVSGNDSAHLLTPKKEIFIVELQRKGVSKIDFLDAGNGRDGWSGDDRIGVGSGVVWVSDWFTGWVGVGRIRHGEEEERKKSESKKRMAQDTIMEVKLNIILLNY